MSRTAKATLVASILVSGLTVWGVHYQQQAERATMYKGVERDEARRAEKAKQKQRQLDHEMNQAREEAFQKIQPTAGFLARQQHQQQQQRSDDGDRIR